MSPSHANKKGVRYRYYVSQAVLQKRKDEAGSIARVAAPDIEELVIAALRHQVGNIDRQVFPGQTLPLLELSDRDLVALHVERIVLRSRHIDITLRGSAFPEGQGTVDASPLGTENAALARDANQRVGSKGHRLEAFGSSKSRSGDKRLIADCDRAGALLDERSQRRPGELIRGDCPK